MPLVSLVEFAAMSYFVVVPGALVPASIASHVLARANLPSLERRLARARIEALQRFEGQGAAHLDWLWSRFGGNEQPPSTAPYALQALESMRSSATTGETFLWHADPVHFAFARDRMLLTRLEGDAAMTADESGILAAEAAAIAAEFGARLRATDTSHWFLVFDSPWRLRTVAFDAALGRSVEPLLPEGDDAARWRKLLTEIQMRWHQHPVNEQREESGRRTVNGLWLHGGAPWQALANKPFAIIAADDPVVRGWGLASGLHPEALLNARSKPPRGGAVLVFRDELLASNAHEDWDRWLEILARFSAELDEHIEHAFSSGFSEFMLVLAGRNDVRTLAIRRYDPVRVWRNHSLPDLFSEAEAA